MVQNALDPRLITIGVQVEGNLVSFNQELAVTAVGVKSWNSIQNSCQVTIANLDTATSEYILSATSPYNLNKTPKIITVDAGRVSYGTSRIFYGNIIRSKPSQPPDIILTFECLTNGFDGGNTISVTQPASTTMREVSQQTAQNLNLTLVFQGTDKAINNYSFSTY